MTACSFQLGQISIGLVFDKANRIFPHIFKGYSRPHFLLKNRPPQELSHGWLLLLEVWRAVERGPLPFQRLQLLQAVLRFHAGALHKFLPPLLLYYPQRIAAVGSPIFSPKTAMKATWPLPGENSGWLQTNKIIRPWQMKYKL